MSLPELKSREILFQILFSMEVANSSKDDLVKLLMNLLKVSKKYVLSAYDNAVEIFSKREALDAEIAKHSKLYKIERISLVEKTVLRLCIYDLFFAKKFSIDDLVKEALRLSNKFSTSQGGKFIHALIDACYKESICGLTTT